MKAISIAMLKKIFRDGTPFTELLPYAAFDPENNMFINVDHSLSFISEFEPIPQVDINADILDRMLVSLKSFLSNPDIPNGSALQFMVYASPFFEEKVNLWYKKHSKSRIPFIRELAEKRREYYISHRNGFFPDEPVVPRIFRHFFTFRYFNSSKEGHIPRTKIENAVKVWNGMVTSLKGISPKTDGLPVKVLGAEEFVWLMREILNQEKVKTEYNPDYFIRDQVFFNTEGIDLMKDGRFTLSGKYVFIISAYIPPKYPFLPKTANVIGDLLYSQANIPYPFLLTVNFHILDQFAIRSKIQTKQTLTMVQANTPLVMFSPKLKLKAETLTKALENFEKGDGFIKVAIHMAIFAPSYEEGRKATQLAQDSFQRAGFTVTEEKAVAFPVFISSLPMAFDPKVDKALHRLITVHHSNAANLCIPILGEWRGTDKEEHANLLFTTRRGQVVTMSLFDSSYSYNAIVAATSGAGKSFLMNEIIVSYLSEGGKVYVLDIGKSYERMGEIVDSQFFEFDIDNPKYILNPFTWARKRDDGEITDSDAAFLRAIVYEMARPTEGGALPPITESVIEEAIRTIFKLKGNAASITDIVNYLDKKGNEKRDQRIKDIAQQLFIFAEGSFSGFFKGKSNISFDKDLIILDMTGLKGETNIPLMRVVLMILFYKVLQDVEFGERSRKKLFVVDEAWKLLSTKQAADVIETAYRTFRKYNAGAITITQSYMDFFELTKEGFQFSPAGKAIVPNTPHKFFLRQQEFTIFEQELDPDRLELLKTIKTRKGHYSEIFYVGPSGSAILRFIPDPASYWVYTTAPDDQARFNEIARRFMSSGLDESEAIAQTIKVLANEEA